MENPKLDTLLVVCPNYWGKAKTVEAALKQCKEAGGHKPFKLFAGTPDIRIDDMGTVTARAIWDLGPIKG